MKRVLSISGAVLLTAIMFGQAAQTMSYQAVIWNSSNDLVALNPVGMRVSLLQGFETGTPVYVETSPLKSEPSELVATHYVGEIYGGGVVFYVDYEGKHGLITATIDKSTRKQQLNETKILTNAVSVGNPTGKYNSDRINVIKGAGADDAQVVENYQDANLSEWYLPTRYDLNKLYLNRSVIGGYAAFSKGWKSYRVSSVNEWYKSFVTGGEFSNGKDDAVYIRVIRNF